MTRAGSATGRIVSWTFERRFYGTKAGLDAHSIGEYLMLAYYFIPRTLFSGLYRAVVRVGDHDGVYERIERPWPDILEAQKPQERFALQLSGGFDSSILAMLYDRPDADYIHLVGPESDKARGLAAGLEGTLHELEITPELFIETADELMPRLPEPYAFEDVVFCQLASRRARDLGHTLVVSGDGGDGVLGGGNSYPYDRKNFVIWKTLDPNGLLGLRTLQPFMHSGLYAWAMTSLAPEERARDKRFARQFCRSLGMPSIVTGQVKGFWAGGHQTRDDPKVLQHMQAVVTDSDYRAIREIRFPRKPLVDFPFRQYSLVKWLQANHQERLSSVDRRQFERDMRELDLTDPTARTPRDRLKQLVPPLALPYVRRVRHWLTDPR